MKRLILISFAVLAGLVWTAAASAKEMTLEQVCGTNGCHAFKSGTLANHDGGLHAASAPALQGYYKLKVGIGDGHKIFEHLEMYYVPKVGAVNGKFFEGWSAFPAGVTSKIDAAAKGLKPFGVPRVASAYVNQHRSVDAAAYGDLLGPLDKAEIPLTSEAPVMISLIWAQPNPWSNDAALLSFLPRAKVLMRGDGYFHLPGSLAGRLDRERQGLAPVVPGDGFPWTILVGSLAGALALGTAAAMLVRRRRLRPAEGPVPA